MIFKINNVSFKPISYKLLADNCLLMSEFNIVLMASGGLEIGTKISIFNPDESLFMTGIVEVITELNGNIYIVSGRSKLKNIKNIQLEKTTQYKDIKKLSEIFNQTLSKYDIKVLGDATIPEKKEIILYSGENIIDSIESLAAELGISLWCDAEDYLVIEKPQGGIKYTLKRSNAIIKSDLTESGADFFTKCLVRGGDEVSPNKPSNKYSECEKGEGERTLVVDYPYPLTNSECSEIAERILYQNLKFQKRYFANLTTTLSLNINDVCLIDDEEKDFKEKMQVRRIERSLAKGKLEFFCYFEATKE